jgi:hypothetical protein
MDLHPGDPDVSSGSMSPEASAAGRPFPQAEREMTHQIAFTRAERRRRKMIGLWNGRSCRGGIVHAIVACASTLGLADPPPAMDMRA